MALLAPVAYPSYPTTSSSESSHFQHEHRDDALSLPSLPLPHDIGAPPSGSGVLTESVHIPRHLRHPLPCDTPVLCRPLTLEARPLTLPAPRHGHGQGLGHLRQSSQQSASFHTLPLPPPPSATGLSMSVVGVVPAKRSHRSRSGAGWRICLTASVKRTSMKRGAGSAGETRRMIPYVAFFIRELLERYIDYL
ncbi:hypothetical protein DFH11DRAFT_981711 [Phellopilus nigrolimitatus]|nr:hypothetical protein DFH11DRAFT_981711 [Phellopilus nigrolimitatus]